MEPLPDQPWTAVASVALSKLPESVRAALNAADDRKAKNIVALDLRGLTDATDFFVVASGTSDAHVRGIANLVLERLEELGVGAHHVEGLTGGRWVLLDFVDFVVHLFHPEARAFYQLERLWGDAPELTFSPTPERKA
jgi:ribosome-associated protein